MKLRFSLRYFGKAHHIRAGVWMVVGMWTALVLLIWELQLFRIGNWEHQSYNARFHRRGPVPSDPRLVLIGIDEPSILGEVDEDEIKENPGYECLKDFPYHRRAYAMALDKLFKAGAKLVIFDLLFTKESPLGATPEGRADDAALAKAIRRYKDKVVMGANYTEGETTFGSVTTQPLQMPTSLVLPDDLPITNIVGLVNYYPDDDGFIRRMNAVGWPHLRGDEREAIPYSIDALAIKKAFPEVALPEKDVPRWIVFAGGRGTYEPIPFYKLFQTKAWEPGRPPLFGGTIFRDKIVLIGPRANFMHDEHLTPFGDGTPSLMPGPDIHMHAMATLLSGREIRVANAHDFWIIALAGVLYGVILPFARSALGKLVPACGFGIGYFWLAQWFFEGSDLFIPLIPVEIIVVGSAISVVAFQAVTEQLEKRRVAGMFQQYVSKNIAVELMKSGQDVDSILAPQIRTVTMLFSDIRGFTAMTERSDPKQLFSQLNEYLTAMVECVFNNDGTLDKFVGDAVVAVFGSPASRGHADDAWNAVKTALDMRARLAELNAKWAKEGKEPWRIGIGLNHGAVMAGDIGSNQKKEFGVIGDPVNVAARVESETKTQKTDILITDSVYQFVKDRVEVEVRGGIKVKGRDKPVEMYALRGLLRTTAAKAV